jgi:dimethylaniline monooxygenase (N-oxide forming)
MCGVYAGKSALDMATLSGEYSAQTFHLFREPRWTLPDRICGLDFSYFLFNRLGTLMVTCWTQPSAWARGLHQQATAVMLFWSLVGWLLKFQAAWYGIGKSASAKRRLQQTQPTLPLLHDKKFVVAIVPKEYYPRVAEGRIEPMQDQLVAFTEKGVKLRSGHQIPCNMVVLSLGNQTPDFPFLPEKQRWLMEREGGAQLYRHLIHPRIPRLGFAGFNHCFMHLPAVEIGTLWIIASWRGELELPSVEVSSQPAHLVLAVPTMIMCAASGVLCVCFVVLCCVVWSGHGAECEESDGVEERKHRIRTHTCIYCFDPISAVSGHVVTGLGTESLPQNAQYICGNVL